MREIVIGFLASMFFAVTFILNRSMELSGGSWLWSSSLRFIFMFPFFLLIVFFRRNGKQVLQEIKKQPLPWIMWSFVGFVMFYAPLTYAASYGPGWLIAGTWQITIIAGALLVPFFFTEKVKTAKGMKTVRKKTPKKSLAISLFILAGVLLIQLQHASSLPLHTFIAGILPVLIAACAYPLGNRKMMEISGGRLDTFQRIFGMTLVSLPFWLLLSFIAFIDSGAPSTDQVVQTFIVAVFSGVIATTLFFVATDRVKHNQGKLAAVEATQSTQVLFVLAGEVFLLSSPLPNGLAIGGLFIIMLGMLLHSYLSKLSSPSQRTPFLFHKSKGEKL
ncbi:multidrug resistance efflux transporter family protein [Thalassorhabdus alkalitolerans]|uniref:Multidrug resistance efflux transporter family protein n=1 Tax=Thalassorhabdus alkalitolerans TaxID=2282697 RepID=A0ABW0YS96_9BACI